MLIVLALGHVDLDAEETSHRHGNSGASLTIMAQSIQASTSQCNSQKRLTNTAFAVGELADLARLKNRLGSRSPQRECPLVYLINIKMMAEIALQQESLFPEPTVMHYPIAFG
jgi:hypothetical protein